MRLIFLGPFGFHPNKTMRSRAMGFARELVKSGHSVKLVMPPWQTPNEAGKTWSEDGVELEYVTLSGGILLTVGRMVAAVRAYQPDVVVGFKPKAYSGLAMFWLTSVFGGRYSVNGKRPLLVTDTDDWEGWGGWNDIADYSTIQKYFFAWQEKWGMTHCDLLTFASRELGKRAEQMGVGEGQRLYLPNGPGIRTNLIPTDQISAKRQALGLANRPTLLLYSRLFEFDSGRLTAILQAVQKQVPNLAILAVGAGLFDDQAADLRQRLADANLLDRMIDTGWLDEADLPETLLSADVGLYLMDDTLLNRTKCPVKLADMVALGIPVVAEAVGEVTLYVADGENGRLRPTGDVEGVSAALVEILQNKALARRMGEAGRKRHGELFGWEATTLKLTAKIAELA